MSGAQEFHPHVPDDELADLAGRLAHTRRVRDPDVADWEAGTSPAYLGALLDHWKTRYRWRAREAELNQLHHFLITLGDDVIHFVHERGHGPRPLPLILTHGYPDSFLRFRKLIPLLVDPAAHGGDPEDAFDVVVPSLPGYAWSTTPRRHPATLPAGGEPRPSSAPSPHADIFHIGDLWHQLMTQLGYARYGAHGGDWGSTVTEHLARSHKTAVVGIHLTDVPFWHAFQKPSDASAAEREMFAAMDRFQAEDGAYAMIQGQRPDALADGLYDSPAGLAAWLVEKFQRWSDCDGDLDSRFTKDELLDHIMLYWTTGTIGSAFQPYFDLMHAGAGRWMIEKAKDLIARSHVPAGFAIAPHDTVRPPREWAERFFHVARWTELPRGGHFAAHEEPELIAAELRGFFRPLRAYNET